MIRNPWISVLGVLVLVFLNWIVWRHYFGLPSFDNLASLSAKLVELEALSTAPCEDLQPTEAIEDEATSESQGRLPPVLFSNFLVERLQSATVVVYHKGGSGTGFLIDSQTVVTNKHVVESAAGGQVYVGSRLLERPIRGIVKALSVGATDKGPGSIDFALVMIDEKIPNSQILALASDPQPLETAIAVGFPGSGIQTDLTSAFPDPIFTSGVVSAIQPQESGARLIIHSADISPGSSGGRLVDGCGNVIGINTFILTRDDRAETRRLYAIASSTLQGFLNEKSQHYSKTARCASSLSNRTGRLP